MQDPIYSVTDAINFVPELNTEYIITWDEIDYNVQLIENEENNLPYLGNENYVNMVSGGDIPFAIIFSGNTIYLATESTENSHTIKIAKPKTNIKQLDKKFIPNIGVDWEENDEGAPGYINNKPFYEQNSINMIVTDLTKTDYQNSIKPQCTFIPGEIYNVIWNGITYTDLTCYANGSYNVIASNDTGHPFYIDDDGGNGLYVNSEDSNEDWTLSIYTGEVFIKKIEEKFIPDTIARVDDIRNNFGTIKLNQLILVDEVTGYEYRIEMRNGTLVSSLEIASIEVTTNPTKFFYEDGENFDPAGMIVKAIYPDGTSTEIVDYTYSEIINSIVTITYERKGVKYITKLKVQTIESLLEDFEYTVDNNIFTLTEWKQTLNGEPSTELIVPKLPNKYKIIV
jgi:hypothetical protein